ncbi:MAG: hypothetical protein ABH840_04230 [Nanoarchaeota archaeon]
MEKDNFEIRKRRQLEMSDNSSIGRWDGKIKNLCEKINKNGNYYTTSSCAGRIVLIKQAEKKQPDLFLFRSHEKITFSKLRKELEKAMKSNKKDLVYFRQEQCILHVACKTLEDAQNLLDKAKQVGWKNSGIMASRERIVLEMRSTEHIEFPIINKGKMVVDDIFLKLLVKETNRKLEKTWEKIQKLEKLLL